MGDRERIRKSLAEYRLTYKWLLLQLHLKGIETDKSTLSLAISGTRSGDTYKNIVLMINEILDEYERYFINRVID